MLAGLSLILSLMLCFSLISHSRSEVLISMRLKDWSTHLNKSTVIISSFGSGLIWLRFCQLELFSTKQAVPTNYCVSLGSHDFTAWSRWLSKIVANFRLLRMMRLMKNRRQYTRFVRSVLRISIGIERLFLFAVLTLLLCHMSSCIWYFLA